MFSHRLGWAWVKVGEGLPGNMGSRVGLVFRLSKRGEILRCIAKEKEWGSVLYCTVLNGIINGGREGGGRKKTMHACLGKRYAITFRVLFNRLD